MPTAPKTAHIRITRPAARHADARLTVEGDYLPKFVAALKAAIPAHDRAWSEEERAWIVRPRWLDTVKDLARCHYQSAWLIDEGTGDRTDLHTGATHQQMTLFA